MNAPAKLSHKNHVKQVLNLQLMLIVLITLVCFGVCSTLKAQAYFIGSMVAWFGNFIVAQYGFRYVSARHDVLIVKSLYKGQMIKWFFTVSVLIIIFKYYKNLNLLFLFLGFSLSQFNNWLFLFIKNK